MGVHRTPAPVLGLLVALAAGLGVAALGAGGTAPDAAGAEVDGAAFRLVADGSGAPVLDARARAAGLRFDPAVTAADRRAIAEAIAAARPEARALVAAVDGLVDVRVGPSAPGTAGTTTHAGGRYAVQLDLAAVSARLGPRGVSRLVLHELAHVLDSAVLPAALDRELDARVPRGLSCERGVTGTCAPREERFAESFAKWATGDIGVGLTIGYEIPPPSPTPERWGEPLARLAAAAG